MTDAEGAVRWSGDYGSFGAVNGQTQDSEGLRHGKPVESQPLRYAGQYADEETGLHYNLFRYYDPTVGRFTTQDPIGLAGGLIFISMRLIRWGGWIRWVYSGFVHLAIKVDQKVFVNEI
nr:type IV secretion protein Rhs [Pectobacterium parmentieri]